MFIPKSLKRDPEYKDLLKERASINLSLIIIAVEEEQEGHHKGYKGRC